MKVKLDTRQLAGEMVGMVCNRDSKARDKESETFRCPAVVPRPRPRRRTVALSLSALYLRPAPAAACRHSATAPRQRTSHHPVHIYVPQTTLRTGCGVVG